MFLANQFMQIGNFFNTYPTRFSFLIQKLVNDTCVITTNMYCFGKIDTQFYTYVLTTWP
jgi:hypothetical protein